MYVIETILPDGPHWYTGVKEERKGEHIIRGAHWSPYWEDRKPMNKEQAFVNYEVACKSMDGCYIVQEDAALSNDTWILLEGDLISVRAKYLLPDLIVVFPGRVGQWCVINSNEKGFLLRQWQGGNATGSEFSIGRKSIQRVTVIGKRERRARETTN